MQMERGMYVEEKKENRIMQLKKNNKKKNQWKHPNYIKWHNPITVHC